MLSWILYIYHYMRTSLYWLYPLFGQRPRREPEGTKSCRIQGESVRPYVRTSARPPPGWPPSEAGSGLSKMDGWTDGRMDGRMRRTDETDGRTDYPCILQDFVPSGSLRGRCPAYTIATIIKYQSRARVPMTISCLWATGFYSIHPSMHRFLHRIQSPISSSNLCFAVDVVVVIDIKSSGYAETIVKEAMP